MIELIEQSLACVKKNTVLRHFGSHMWTEHGMSLRLVLGGYRAAAEGFHLPEKSNSTSG